MRRKTICIMCALIAASVMAGHVTAVRAGEQEVTAVVQAIDALPGEDDILSDEATAAATEARKAFDALSVGDRLKVTNLNKLEAFETRVEEANSEEPEEEEEKTLADVVHETETEYDKDPYETVTINETNEYYGTYYTVDIDDERPTRTIIVHYVTDQDRDGVMEVPELSLTSPNDVTTILSQSTAKLKDDTISATLSWQPGYMQIDIEYATPGKWAVVSSVTVSYEEKDYNGSTQNYDDEAITDREQKERYQGESGGLNVTAMVKSLLPLVVVVVGFIVVMIFINRKPDKKSKAKADKEKPSLKRENIDDRISAGSHNENDELLALKEEYKQMLKQYSDEPEEEEVREIKRKPKKNKKKAVTQEDIDNDVTIAEFEEGNTSVLKKKAKQKAMEIKEQNAEEQERPKREEPAAQEETAPHPSEADAPEESFGESAEPDDPFGGM